MNLFGVLPKALFGEIFTSLKNQKYPSAIVTKNIRKNENGIYTTTINEMTITNLEVENELIKSLTYDRSKYVFKYY